MLHFVQHFRRKWLQIKEDRPKCCTFCNIEPQMRPVSPFLLYKMQHSRMSATIVCRGIYK
nr:hypothetical protein [Paenibacillus ginsengihumi]